MFKFVEKLFNRDGQLVDSFIDFMATKNQLSSLALEIAFSKIAQLISKCPIKVYSDDEDKNLTEYRLNVRPNPNETGTEFWQAVVMKMLKDDEGCLVVQMNDGCIYHADSYTRSNDVLKPATFSNVSISIDGNTVQLKKKFNKNNAVLFKYENRKLKQYLKSINDENDLAWNVAIKGFKNKSPKYRLSIPGSMTLVDSNTKKPITANEYSEKIKTQLTEDDVKLIMLNNNIALETIESKSSLTSSDIKALKDEVFTNVAIALGIPKTVFYGEVTEKSDANNEFITYAASPIIEALNDGMNATWLDEEEYLRGDKILIDTTAIKHIDLIEQAGNLDKLYSNGWSFNDVLELFGKPPIDEDWANARRFTKNYSTSVDGEDMKGGEG